jgi:hypothetical protein
MKIQVAPVCTVTLLKCLPIDCKRNAAMVREHPAETKDYQTGNHVVPSSILHHTSAGDI